MVIVANKNQITDGSAHEMLSRLNIEVPIVLISWAENFVFNDELLKLDKYIVADFMEHNWGAQLEDMCLFGAGELTNKFNRDEWRKLDDFVAKKRPLIYFKRELPFAKATNDTLPIEYCFSHEVQPVQTEDQFNSRPLDVFFNWGLSNPIRPRLHGEIWSRMNEFGYIVCDNFQTVNGFIQNESNPRKWLTVNTPHYARFPIENILEVNRHAKISVSLFGAGRKCFRSVEAPSNSVMFCQEDALAWTHSWVSGINCLSFYSPNSMIEKLNKASQRKDLYEIYVRGVETVKKYQINEYVSGLEKIIKKRI